MRKLFTSFLALALASSISAAAFATTTNSDTNTGSGSTSINVSGVFKTAAASAISVDITWDNMDFTYLDNGTWNPKTHSLSKEATWRWNGATEDKPNPMITVTNHSYIDVKATFEFTSKVDGLAGSFTGLTDNILSLDSAFNTPVENAPTKSTSFSITDGTIDQDYDTLGTITVTISKDPLLNSKDTTSDTDVTP